MGLIVVNVQGQTSTAPFGTGQYTGSNFTPFNKQLIVAGVFAAETTNAGGDFSNDLTISDSVGLTWTSRGRVNIPNWSAGIRVWTAQVQLGQSMNISFDCGARNIHVYRTQHLGIFGHEESDPFVQGNTATDPDGDGSLSFAYPATPNADSEQICYVQTMLSSGSPIMLPGADWAGLTQEGVIANWFIHMLMRKSANKHLNAIDVSDLSSGTATPLGSGAVALEIRERRQGNSPFFLLRP